MQWLALEHPVQARAVRYFVKRMIMKHRGATADIRSELTGRMEYMHVAVANPSALIIPAEHRIGRRMHDIMPDRLMEVIDPTLYQARRTQRSMPFDYTRQDGVMFRGAIAVEGPDLITISANILDDGQSR